MACSWVRERIGYIVGFEVGWPIRMRRCWVCKRAVGEETDDLSDCGLERPSVGRVCGAVGGYDLSEGEKVGEF